MPPPPTLLDRSIAKTTIITTSEEMSTQTIPHERQERIVVVEHRVKRFALYTEAVKLREKGVSSSEIAEQVGKSIRTVQRWVSEGRYRHDLRRRRSMVDKHLPFLKMRWDEGCHNLMQLQRELSEQGFNVAYRALRHFIQRNFSPSIDLPPLPPAPNQAIHNGKFVRRIRRSGNAPLTPIPSPRQTLWMLLKPEKLNKHEREAMDRLISLSPEIKRSVDLVIDFRCLMREKRIVALMIG